jgi:hypothetical protein
MDWSPDLFIATMIRIGLRNASAHFARDGYSQIARRGVRPQWDALPVLSFRSSGTLQQLQGDISALAAQQTVGFPFEVVVVHEESFKFLDPFSRQI